MRGENTITRMQSKETRDAVEKCIGRTYRGSINSYINSKGAFVTTKRLNLLKRKSCTGCIICDAEDEVINEDLYEQCLHIDDIKQDKLYQIIVNWNEYQSEYGTECDPEVEIIEVDE